MESAARGVLAADLGRSVTAPHVRRARLFYPALAIVMLVAVFAGFAPSYYLKTLYGSKPLPLLFHVHGAAFTSWMLLLVLQSTLIAAGQTPLHRRLGVAGGGLAVLMTALAWLMAIDLGRRAGNDPAALGFMTIPMATVVVFPTLVGAALLWRRFPATHKRLMMIATIELSSAGIGRIPGVATFGPLSFFSATDLLLVALLVHDWMTQGRIHRATLWGGAFLIASQVVRTLAGGTDAWLALARWLSA